MTRLPLQCYLEPTNFILRLTAGEIAAAGPKPWPYVGTGSVTIDDEGLACIRGLVVLPDYFRLHARHAVDEALARIGARCALFSSRQDDGRMVHRRSLVTNPGPRLYL